MFDYVTINGNAWLIETRHTGVRFRRMSTSFLIFSILSELLRLMHLHATCLNAEVSMARCTCAKLPLPKQCDMTRKRSIFCQTISEIEALGRRDIYFGLQRREPWRSGIEDVDLVLGFLVQHTTLKSCKQGDERGSRRFAWQITLRGRNLKYVSIHEQDGCLADPVAIQDEAIGGVVLGRGNKSEPC